MRRGAGKKDPFRKKKGTGKGKKDMCGRRKKKTKFSSGTSSLRVRYMSLKTNKIFRQTFHGAAEKSG